MEREEAEQEELEVAKVLLSLAGAMRKAAKVAELAGVAESAKARPATTQNGFLSLHMSDRSVNCCHAVLFAAA